MADYGFVVRGLCLTFVSAIVACAGGQTPIVTAEQQTAEEVATSVEADREAGEPEPVRNPALSKLVLYVDSNDSALESLVAELSEQLSKRGFRIVDNSNDAGVQGVVSQRDNAISVGLRRIQHLGTLSTPISTLENCKNSWRCEGIKLVKDLLVAFPNESSFYVEKYLSEQSDKANKITQELGNEIAEELKKNAKEISTKLVPGQVMLIGTTISENERLTKASINMYRSAFDMVLEVVVDDLHACKGDPQCIRRRIARDVSNTMASSSEVLEFASRFESVEEAENQEIIKQADLAVQRKQEEQERYTQACAVLESNRVVASDVLESAAETCPDKVTEAHKEELKRIHLLRSLDNDFEIVKNKDSSAMRSFYYKYYPTGDPRVETIRKLALKQFGPTQSTRFVAARRTIVRMSSDHLKTDLCDFRDGVADVSLRMSMGAAFLTLGKIMFGGYGSSGVSQAADAMDISEKKLVRATKAQLGAQKVRVYGSECSTDHWYLYPEPWPPPKAKRR